MSAPERKLNFVELNENLANSHSNIHDCILDFVRNFSRGQQSNSENAAMKMRKDKENSSKRTSMKSCKSLDSIYEKLQNKNSSDEAAAKAKSIGIINQINGKDKKRRERKKKLIIEITNEFKEQALQNNSVVITHHKLIEKTKSKTLNTHSNPLLTNNEDDIMEDKNLNDKYNN